MRLRNIRKRNQLFLFGGALLLPALLLVLLSAKLLKDLAGIGAAVRAEYGTYVADIASSGLENALLEIEQRNMVAARFDPPENPREITQFLRDFQNENPFYLTAFFVLPEGLVYFPPSTKGFRFQPLPSWIKEPIMATLDGNVPTGLLHLTGRDGDAPAQVTYFTVATPTGQGAAGFIWDLEALARNRPFIRDAINRALSREQHLFQGEFLGSPVRISLLDAQGNTVYEPRERSELDEVVVTRPLNRVLPFYNLAVAMNPDDRLGSWVDSVVKTNAALIAAMFLMTLLAFLFSARFVMHELRLASLKSTLVSNVSHELKTPLALIRMYAETLSLDRAGSQEKKREFLRIIERESERLTNLINNVLDLGRIEQGRKTYHKAPTDLAQVVRTTMEGYELSLDGFEVETRIEDDLPSIYADPNAMIQVLINLVDNAVKYSVEDDKRLKVTLRREGDRLCLAVSDRGVGIAPVERKRIFEAFYRIERGLGHDVKGSGLGLSLVRHIVDAHGGTIDVKSEGRGSTFTIKLPLNGDAQHQG